MMFIGLFLVLLGIFLIFIAGILNKKVKTEWGFFGLIGPIPIGFWSSKTMFLLTLAFLVLFIIIIFMIFKWW